MKKIFTLLFAVGMFTLAQAQPGTRDNRQNDQREVIKVVVNDNDRYDKRQMTAMTTAASARKDA